jgi:hypothetical protein
MISFFELPNERYPVIFHEKLHHKKTNLNVYMNYRHGRMVSIDMDDDDYVIEALHSDG